MQVLITTVLTTIRDEWMFSNDVPLSRKPIFKNIINILTVLCSLYNIYKYILNTISILLPYMYNNSMLIIILTALFLHWSGSSRSWTEYILKCKPSITEPLIPQVRPWMELYKLAKENLAAVNRIAVCLLSSMLHVFNLTARPSCD